MEDPPEHVFCPACGSVLEELEEQLETKELVIQGQEKRIRALLAQNGRLQAEQSQQEGASAYREEARQVFAYWKREVQPAARVFGPERFKAVEARLEDGHSVEFICEAVDGAKTKPPEGGGKTDLYTICRNEKNLLMFWGWAPKKPPPVKANPVLEENYALMRAALTGGIVQRLEELRGWTQEAVRGLGLGFDSASKRIVFPARAGSGTLVGYSRYQPNPALRNGDPKNIAEGMRELFPAPETMTAESIWLVEGEPDAVAMYSIGQPAVAVPGVAIWKDGWEQRFANFERVRICFDCDDEGREAARKRMRSLSSVTETEVVDLKGPHDHFDVNDLLLVHGASASSVLAALARPAHVGANMSLFEQPQDSDPRRPIERVRDALEARQARIRDRSGGFESTCPNHDDRHPSLSVTEGDDRRVLMHCHAGCEPEDVRQSLGLEWKDLFG